MARMSPHDEPEFVPARLSRGGDRPDWATDEFMENELAAQDRADRDEARSTRRTARREAWRAKPGRSPRAAAGRVRERTVAPLRMDTDATGFVLALMFWGWVVLPMLKADSPAQMPAAVGNVLRAKFFNKGPDGEWLA